MNDNYNERENENLLGNYVESLRDEAGLSRNKFAKLCKISRTEIVRIEEGISKSPAINNLSKISSVLHCDYSYLLALAGYYPKDEEPKISFFYPGLTKAKVDALEQIIKLFDIYTLTNQDIEDIVIQVKTYTLIKMQNRK